MVSLRPVTYRGFMGHWVLWIVVLIYVFVVGHFNFAVALTSGVAMLLAYHRHEGEWQDDLW